MNKRLAKAAAFVVMASLAVGVIGNNSTVSKAAKVKLSKSKAILKAGESIKLKVKNYKGKVKWSSSKKKVASVSKKGVVTAKKKGKAVITAKAGAKKLTCKVTVRNAKAEVSPSAVPSAQTTSTPQTPVQNTPIPDKPVNPTTEPTNEPTKVPEPTATPKYMQEGAFVYDKLDISWIDPEKPMIAFTFDDGPYAKVTRRILKALNKSNGRATFFVVGNRVPEFSETLALQYEQGNQIGSHTFDHKDLSKMKAKKIKWEINKTNQKVSKVIGCNTTALRPPYGNVSDTMRKTIKTPMYYWSIDSEDWKSRNANSIVKRCKDAKDGDIILMHDLYPTTADAVERLAPYFVKKGFQLVTLDEMFYYKHKDAEPGKVYFSAR